MKALLLSCLLLTGLQAAGQALPIDSTTHKVTYQGVIQAPGVAKSELYNRAREWFATSFGSSKTVLDIDDKEAGKLIGKANSPFLFNGVLPSAIWRTIRIEVKEGRYQYTLTGFGMEAPGDPYGSGHPIEAWLTEGKRNKSTARMAGSVLEEAKASATSEIASLQKAMAATKNW